MDEPSIYRRLNEHRPDLGGDPDDGEEDFFEPEDQAEASIESGGSLSDAIRTINGVQPSAIPHVTTMLCGGDVYYADGQPMPQTTRLHGDDNGKRKPIRSTSTSAWF